jgi:hypothetical protein
MPQVERSAMNHISEDDLTLYYYGEGRRRREIAQHLHDCERCASVYREISGTLALIVADAVPERGESYGLDVWQRIRSRISEEPDGKRFKGFKGFRWFAEITEGTEWRRLSFAGALAALVLAAFVAGYFAHSRSQVSTTAQNPANPANPLNREMSRRILLTSVADHLDRTDRVLTDIMNAEGGSTRDISAEQRWAEELVVASRLYRQDAADAGERSIAAVLDELERNLLEIVHSPSAISASDLEQIRRRIDAAALLFKVRVMSDDLRRRESPPSDRPAAKASTSKIS